MTSRTVSIIIPCYNQAACTRRCVESILEAGDGDCELILVDNGSEDGTGELLSSLEGRDRPPVTVIRNRENRGVAGALNQGIAVARGEYVCYLNSDTLVTPGWLEGLRRCAESDPRIGIAGCSTNPESGTADGFHTTEGLRTPGEIRRTAALVSLANKGTVQDVHYVHGFCMFITRAAIRKIGPFDERFFPCCCEDFDYSLRARRAGFRVVVARDVYVYHFYHQSSAGKPFKERYEDLDAVTKKAHRLFLEKWGTDGKDFLDELERIIREERNART